MKSQKSSDTKQLDKPTLAIFCHELKEGGDPFSTEFYWDAYQELLFALKDRGIDAYFATDNNTYKDYGLFEKVYTLDAMGSVSDLKAVENVHVDLVFDRGSFMGRNVPMINPAIMTKIAKNKIEMYEYFANLQPTSAVGETKDETARAIEEIPGDKVVVKEPEGSGGNEVYIGTKSDVLAELPNEYPLLVQEFLDTSIGVPGVVKGVHDVRIGICGGEVISYFVRNAEEGRLHANIAQGGSATYFDVSEAPNELIAIVKDVDGLFADEPRYYSIDFMNTPKGWKLVEINSYVGMMPAYEGPEARDTQQKLADYLAAQCSAVQQM